MNWQRYLHSIGQQFFPDDRGCMCPIYWDPFLKKITNTVRSYTVIAERKYFLGFSATYINKSSKKCFVMKEINSIIVYMNRLTQLLIYSVNK
jgi:hypothetical protein